MNDTLEIAHEIWALAQTHPSDGIEDAAERISTRLQSFREEIEKLERERCAKVCEEQFVGESLYADISNEGDQAYNLALQHCAEAIRKGDKP